MRYKIDSTVKNYINNLSENYFDDCDLLYVCFDTLDSKNIDIVDFASIFIESYKKYVDKILPLKDYDFNTTELITELYNEYCKVLTI